MGYSVFFSHSGTDKQWARWIAQSANGVGIKVYLYEHDPQPGVPIATKIKLAIQSSDALVVLLTSRGRSSAYVQQEIGYSEASGKLIIPLVWPGLQKDSLAMLEGREYVSFNPTNPQEALKTLLAYLQELKAKKEAKQALLALGALILTAVLVAGQK